MIERLEGRVLELALYMSHLSDESYSASWMDGLEYALWYAVENGPIEYGRITICEEKIGKLKVFSEEIRGWIYFDEKSEESFIEIEAWSTSYRNNLHKYSEKFK